MSTKKKAVTAPKVDGYYPVAAIAHICDLDPRRIQQLVKEGIIPKGRRGEYHLAEVTRAYIRFLRTNQQERTPGRVGNEIEEEKLKLLRIQTRSAERELALVEGSQVDVGLFRATLARAYGAVRERLVAFGNRLAPEVLHLETEEDAEKIIDPYVLELIDELRLQQLPGTAPAVPVATDTPAPDPVPVLPPAAVTPARAVTTSPTVTKNKSGKSAAPKKRAKS